MGEREREVKDWRKEGNGLRGRGFVREYLTKKQEDFMMGRADLVPKKEVFGRQNAIAFWHEFSEISLDFGADLVPKLRPILQPK